MRRSLFDLGKEWIETKTRLTGRPQKLKTKSLALEHSTVLRMPQKEEAEALPNGISEEITEGRSRVAAQRTGDD